MVCMAGRFGTEGQVESVVWYLGGAQASVAAGNASSVPAYEKNQCLLPAFSPSTGPRDLMTDCA